MRGTCWDHGQKGNSGGYGHARQEGRTVYAHRKAYADSVGGLVSELCGVVMHTCDNPRCINPAHLRLGTYKDNTADMLRKGRHRVPVGERSTVSVLTNVQVAAIRDRYIPRCRVNGARALGREFGVAEATIRDVLKQRTWRTV